jgi:hypothetical protein
MALNLPAFVIERETGDLSVYSNEADVLLIASEFWDILDEDFLFFDADGRRLRFPTSLPNGTEPDILEASADEQEVLADALERFASVHGIRWMRTESTRSFLDAMADANE